MEAAGVEAEETFGLAVEDDFRLIFGGYFLVNEGMDWSNNGSVALRLGHCLVYAESSWEVQH